MTGCTAADRPPYHLGFSSREREVVAEALPVEGALPPWLAGALLRTAPARFEVGGRSYKHWFDGLAMLHRFAFAQRCVSYASRFLHSGSYCDAERQGRIARGEFATDPCRTRRGSKPGHTRSWIGVAGIGDGTF